MSDPIFTYVETASPRGPKVRPVLVDMVTAWNGTRDDSVLVKEYPLDNVPMGEVGIMKASNGVYNNVPEGIPRIEIATKTKLVYAGDYSLSSMIKERSKLRTFVNNLLARISREDQTNYTVASYNALQVQVVIASGIAGDLFATHTALRWAINQLVPAYKALVWEPWPTDPPEHKEELYWLIQTVLGLTENDYTVPTWTALQAQIAPSQAVYDDNNAYMWQIAEQYELLNNAYVSLELIP